MACWPIGGICPILGPLIKQILTSLRPTGKTTRTSKWFLLVVMSKLHQPNLWTTFRAWWAMGTHSMWTRQLTSRYHLMTHTPHDTSTPIMESTLSTTISSRITSKIQITFTSTIKICWQGRDRVEYSRRPPNTQSRIQLRFTRSSSETSNCKIGARFRKRLKVRSRRESTTILM